MTPLVLVFLTGLAAYLVIQGIFRLTLAILKGLWKTVVFLVMLPIKAVTFVTTFFNFKKKN